MSIHLIHKESTERVPKIIRCIAFGCLAKVFGMKHLVPARTYDIKPVASQRKTITSHENKDDFEKNPSSVDILVSLLDEMRIITRKINGNDEECQAALEWKLLAKLLDRVLFYICLISFIILTTATLLT